MSGEVFHAPLINNSENYDLAGIVTKNSVRIKKIEKKYPNTKIYKTIEGLLKNDEITLVVVGTPNQFHFSIADKALSNNKHVILEKPFTVTTKEADKLIHKAHKKNLMLTAYHNRRLDSDFLTLQRLIKENKVGEVRELISHFDRFAPIAPKNKWRYKNLPGAGVLYDLGSHLIDQALVLFGLPNSIFADLRKERIGSETIDAFHLILFYDDLRVILSSSFMVKGKRLKFQLNGTKGTFRKYGLDVQEEHLVSGETPGKVFEWGQEPRRLWGTLDSVDTYSIIESEKGDYPYFYDNIYEHLMNNKPLLVKATEARNVIRLIELAYESHEKSCVIKVNL